MDAIAKPRAQVCVKACHASSKTYTAAEIVLWFVTRYPDGQVVSTAPTQSQVRDLLWAEIRKARETSLIELPMPTINELRIDNGRGAIGRATNQGVRFQGYHGRVLVVIDEAPGVDADIWDAIEGIRAGGDVRVLALGNPVIASGRFYEIFADEYEGWELFTISAFDTPNLEGYTLDDVLMGPNDDPWLQDNERPYLTTRSWVRERHNTLGGRNCELHVQHSGNSCPALDHSDFQSRVLGMFPTQSADALISAAWLEAAARRPLVDTREGYVAGVDVAGQGKAETVVYVRQGPNVVSCQAFADADPRAAVLAALEPYAHDLTVYVDEIGIGYNFMLHLRDKLAALYRDRRAAARARREDYAGYEPKVAGVNVGDGANEDRFANLKAELYWAIRERLEDGQVCGLTDQRTIAQLGGIRSMSTARGQTAIERKEDAAKRGVPSPDRAEAFMLCYSGAPRLHAIQFGSITGRSKWA